MTPELKSLCDRLEALRDSGRRTLGGGSSCVSTDAKTTAATMYGGDPIMALVNPDGPEAAAKLREMAGALEFYVVICGNTAYSVDREAAMHAYDKARAALGGSHG